MHRRVRLGLVDFHHHPPARRLDVTADGQHRLLPVIDTVQQHLFAGKGVVRRIPLVSGKRPPHRRIPAEPGRQQKHRITGLVPLDDKGLAGLPKPGIIPHQRQDTVHPGFDDDHPDKPFLKRKGAREIEPQIALPVAKQIIDALFGAAAIEEGRIKMPLADQGRIGGGHHHPGRRVNGDADEIIDGGKRVRQDLIHFLQVLPGILIQNRRQTLPQLGPAGDQGKALQVSGMDRVDPGMLNGGDGFQMVDRGTGERALGIVIGEDRADADGRQRHRQQSQHQFRFDLHAAFP